jgi:hypothetical protein
MDTTVTDDAARQLRVNENGSASEQYYAILFPLTRRRADEVTVVMLRARGEHGAAAAACPLPLQQNCCEKAPCRVGDLETTGGNYFLFAYHNVAPPRVSQRVAAAVSYRPLTQSLVVVIIIVVNPSSASLLQLSDYLLCAWLSSSVYLSSSWSVRIA